MRGLLTKILGGALLASVVLISSSAVSAAETAAEYTYNDDKINGVVNSSSATYAYVSSGVIKKLSYSEGDYAAFDETTVSGGVTYLPVSKKIRYFLGYFSSCSELKQVVIEDGVTELPGSAFFYNTNIKEIVFPQNTLSFETTSSYYKQNGTYAYWYAPTFGFTEGLEKYYVSSDYDVALPYGTKATYDFNDGSLLYKLKEDDTYEVIYALPGKTDIAIPGSINGKSVSSIGDSAFSGCLSLEAVNIAAAVNYISENCFDGCSSLTVTCAEGSAADNPSVYPEGTVIIYTEYVTPGDINGDGAVNAADAVLALRYYLGDSELTEAQLKAGDVNGDEKVDSKDAELIVKYDTGEISVF